MKFTNHACFAPTLRTLLLGLAATALASSVATATPYATCLTNSGGNLSFRLNEDADNVKVIWNGNANTNDLGPLLKGLTVTNLGVTGVYKIQVSKIAGPGYLQGEVNQISVDTNNFVKFANGRGLAVNTSPTSPYFGRVYVSCGSAGTANSRNTGDGIYVLNPDQTDAVGQGDNALTAGINFGSNAENPHRLAVGQDDNLYVSDFSDVSGTLYVTDPNVGPGGTNVLAGLGGPFPVTSSRIHGSINGAVVEGSLANSNLTVYVIDEDLQEDRDTTSKFQVNSIWRWDITNTSTLPYSNWPGTRLISPGTLGGFAQTCELRRGPDGKFYVSQRRADNASTAGAFVISSDGLTQLWDSITATRTYLGNPSAFDLLNETIGIDVSRDGKYMATFRRSTNTVCILPLDNGIPNIANIVVMPTTPTTVAGRALAFDAAGNIYTLSSGQGVLRIYSPGGQTTATTGSDGSFAVFAPTPTHAVSATATDLEAGEAGPNNGEFTLTRTSDDNSQALAVRFATSGTASNGVDYVLRTNGVTLTTNWVIFPPGINTLTIALVPTDDTVSEFVETATLTLLSTINYGLTNPVAGTVIISDNDTPMVDIASVSATMFEQTTNDYVRFRLLRRGDTNVSVSVNVAYAGSAVSGSDFSPNSPVTIDVGVTNQTFDVNPLDDSLLETNETVIASVASGTGYVIGTNNPASVTGTIIDDEVPAETVLFSENFNIADSSTNWTLFYAATNLDVPDYSATFAYDYSNDLVPPAPHSGTDTHGLRISVNDTIQTAVGVNLYPNGQNFSGNFALRFDMFLILGNGSLTTEYAVMGVNHSGTKTNWFRNSAGGVPAGWTFDGLFFGVESDAGALGDYVLYSSPNTNNNPTALTPGVNASSLTGTFKVPPYAAAGAPANLLGSTTPSWVQAEVSYIGNSVTLRLNNTTILSYPNTNAYKSGNIMIGYVDGFDSIGPADAGVIYDNVRVVSLDGIRITRTQIVGTNSVLDFTFSVNESPTAFKVQSAALVTGAYTDATATIIQTGVGSYRATVGQSGPNRFYRIRHQ
jgi:hypothetical protein